MIFTNKDMIYDGFNFRGYLVVEDIRRSLLPPIENTTRKIGLHGEKFVKTRTGPTYIEVDVRFIEKDRKKVTEAKNRVISKLLKSEPKMLKLRDEETFEFAIIDGQTDFERFRRTGFATLVFLNPRGVRYGGKISVDIEKEIYNLSTVDVYPVITVENTIGTIGIYNDTTGDRIKINKPLSLSDKLVIGEYTEDMEYKEIIKRNGVNDMKNLSFDSFFITLAPGMNHIRLEGTDSIKIEYRVSTQ